MYNIFIDGNQGTTGLRIFERIGERDDIRLLTLPDELRKDPAARREALNSCDIAFLCLPDAAAVEAVEMITNPSVRVIDTSTAHRTSPDWAYGFPELSAERRNSISQAKRVSVPGCHASGFVSLVAPLVLAGVLSADSRLHAFSLTGYSGGGKKMIAQYENAGRSELFDAPRQYAFSQQHKHLPEMAVQCGLTNEPSFCPIVSDYYSGMMVTVSLFAGDVAAAPSELRGIYSRLYTSEVVRFVESDNFAPEGILSSGYMSGLDRMDITVSGNDERILLVSRFDNLGKGASGAAVQCMNIMLGIDEKTGLKL